MSTEKVTYVISLQDYFTAKIDGATNSANRLDKTVESVQSRLAGMGSMLASAFSVYAIAAFGNGVVKVGEDFEAMQIGLETLLKSSTEASRVFQQIREDAKATPFDVKSLLMANRALISSGISADAAREDVLALANAISATGGGNDELQRMVVNLQQVAATGVATAADVKQFAYAGINIYKLLADATGGNTESVKEMDVSYQMLTKALKDAAKAGGMFENGLGKMQNSIKTMRSNLGDAFDELRNSMFMAFRPAISGTITALNALMNGFNRFMTTVEPFVPIIIEFGQSLNTTLTPAFYALTSALKIGLGVVVTLMEIYNGMPDIFKVAAGTVLTYVTAVWAINKVMKIVRASQMAYNASLAITAALSMNWVALAAAGIVAVGVATWAAADGQEAFNKELEKTESIASKAGDWSGSAGAMSTAKAGGVTTQSIPTAAGAVGKASASKATQITITVGKLIETQNVNVASNNNAVKNGVMNATTEALLSALNDVQRIAAQ